MATHMMHDNAGKYGGSVEGRAKKMHVFRAKGHTNSAKLTVH